MKIIVRVPVKLWARYIEEHPAHTIEINSADKVWQNIVLTSQDNFVDLINFAKKVRSANTVNRLEYLLEQALDLPSNTQQAPTKKES